MVSNHPGSYAALLSLSLLARQIPCNTSYYSIYLVYD